MVDAARRQGITLDDDSYLHDGKKVDITETTVASVTSLLHAQHLDTELRLGCVHSMLFRSSAPPGETLLCQPFMDWDEVRYCRHGHQHYSHAGSAHCGCKLTDLPPTTATVVGTFITVTDAVVAACHAGVLDWSLPAAQGEQNGLANHSMVGELLAEFEHSWSVIIKRVPGATGPNGVAGPAPDWWTCENGFHAKARRANQSWRTTLKGSGARGATHSIAGAGADESVFASTAWLLQYDRLLEFQTHRGVGRQQLHFDDDGVLQLIPVGQRVAAGAGGVAAEAQVVAGDDVPTFSLAQGVKIEGLNGRGDLNGQVGEVLGLVSGGRYPVKVLASGEQVRVKPTNLARTDEHPLEGKRVEGRMMRYGEWFNMQIILDAMMNGGEAAAGAFRALDAKEQADVLAGRRALGRPMDADLPEGCPRREWLGSGGDTCDGCGLTEERFRRLNGYDDDDEGEPFDICERCRYTACADCRVHHSRGTCYCKDSNFDFVYPPEVDREWYHRGYW